MTTGKGQTPGPRRTGLTDGALPSCAYHPPFVVPWARAARLLTLHAGSPPQAQSDRSLQEAPEDVLERSQNFVPDGAWETKESRQRHVLAFIEMRHFLALARQYGDVALAKRITDANHFEVQPQRVGASVEKSDAPGNNASPSFFSTGPSFKEMERRQPDVRGGVEIWWGGARSGSPTSSGRRTVEG